MHARSAQLTAQELLGVFRRRRKYFVIPFAALVFMSICGVIFLPKKYESSTTILVQRDEVLNPLVNYTMAVSMASEDRLKTFNEIVYSLSAIQTLIDSLGLDRANFSEEQRQDLVTKIRKNIETERPGSETFKITYMDSDPDRSQRGVAILARYFIKTVLDVENQRNELAVQFFENKLDELRQKFDQGEKEIVSVMRSRIGEMPVENQTLWENMEDVNKRIGIIEEQEKQYRHGQALLAQIPDANSVKNNLPTLFELQRLDLPQSNELQPLVLKYDEDTRKYTFRYPEVRKLTLQIFDLLTAMKDAIETDITRLQHERSDLEVHKGSLVGNLQQSTAYKEIDKDKTSSFEIVRNLYDDMKVKLEQARTTRDLGRKGGEQFIMLDPPIVPTSPAKPNRVQLLGGGAGLGLFVGIFSAGLAELLDPTIRSPQDIFTYKKKIVAFLPENASS